MLCRIIRGTIGSTDTLLSIGLFLVFVLLLFGVVGMHLFGMASIASTQITSVHTGNRFTWSPKPRANFDTFWSTTLVLFQVLTGIMHLQFDS